MSSFFVFCRNTDVAAYQTNVTRLEGTWMKILVIDDEECIRFTFENFLVEAGHTVTTAQSFTEAIDIMLGHTFDLIFSDIMLGGKTGIDVLRAVRESASDVPVIMITGNPTIDTAAEAVRLGAFDYLQKPVDQGMLLRAVGTASRFLDLHKEKKKYRSNLEAIFRSVRDSIVTVDCRMNILELNDAARDICGLGRDARGGRFDEALSSCGGKCVSILQEAMSENKPVELFRVACGRDAAQRRIVTLKASPLVDGAGNRYGAVMVARDESRLDVLERSLRERKQFHAIIGGSEKMQQLYAMIENLADVQSTVLISSESGTGKELVAEALHYKGSRSRMPLVKVNCSALPESLLESELFGHVKGAFTGALKDKMGRFEKADKGTIFLDEIGDISPAMQVKLLRVLQEKEFERVGEANPIRVDVRVIAATNQDLAEKVRRGVFREDLYYRLNVVKLSIPPLRERLDDLELLADHFLRKFNEKFNKTLNGITPEALDALRKHTWPGNVRELEHALEYACIMGREHAVTLDHLPPEIISRLPGGALREKEEPMSGEAIMAALEKAGGNKSKAARLLGISRRTIYRKIDGR